jgi:Leucine-rich repeat (LRR) protein
MKTLLVCVLLELSILNCYSQKIIFLENQEAYDHSQKFRGKIKHDEEVNKGIWKNNGLVQKKLMIALKKDHNLRALNDAELSLNYIIYFNKNNGIDSLKYYFGKYVQRIVGGKTRFDFEYFSQVSDVQILQLDKIFRDVLKNATFYFNPMRPYEISGGLRYNQYLSKSAGAEYKVAELLKNKKDSDKVLILNNLGLKKLPNAIYDYKNLEELDLSKNEFEVFKLNTKKLPKLKKIVLSENLLSENSIKIKRNKHVQMVSLSDNAFEAFPKRIQRNKELKDIHLANNFIKNTDKIRFKKMKSLELMNFYNNQITALSENIGQLENLKILDLYHNQLNFLPQNILKLKNLETLAVSNNNLWEFPSTLQELPNLKILYAHHNKLSTVNFLPPNIENLDLGFNLLESVPAALKTAPQLSDLDISNNKITSGAEILKLIPGLKKVYLALNDFESDPTKFAELQQIIVDLEKKSVKVK